MPKTIFCDIDGTLFEQSLSVSEMEKTKTEATLLPGSKEKILEWERNGYKIILTTGRKKYYRKFTIWQLKRAGIVFDQLIMDVGIGQRIIINDLKPDSDGFMALAMNVQRNNGLSTICLN